MMTRHQLWCAGGAGRGDVLADAGRVDGLDGSQLQVAAVRPLPGKLDLGNLPVRRIAGGQDLHGRDDDAAAREDLDQVLRDLVDPLDGGYQQVGEPGSQGHWLVAAAVQRGQAAGRDDEDAGRGEGHVQDRGGVVVHDVRLDVPRVGHSRTNEELLGAVVVMMGVVVVMMAAARAAAAAAMVVMRVMWVLVRVEVAGMGAMVVVTMSLGRLLQPRERGRGLGSQ